VVVAVSSSYARTTMTNSGHYAFNKKNRPTKVIRAHPPAVPASKIDECRRHHEELSMDRFVVASRRDAPEGFAPGWASKKYPSYAAYLRGSEWKKIRARVLKRDGYACCTCGWCYSDCKSPMSASDRQLGFWKGGFIPDEQDRRLEVHHEDYSLPTMSGETLAGLKTLCDKCHAEVTRKNRSSPRTFRRDEKTLFD
jgi:5-methylcytosine-specific restriction endonuclease McrA